MDDLINIPEYYECYSFTDHYNAVKTFMEGAQQVVNTCPADPSVADKKLRASLILEEALEQIDALGVTPMIASPESYLPLRMNDITFEVTHKFDPQALLDACCDIMVINTGTAITCGLPVTCLREAVEAVDDNNLTKLNGPDGPIIREDGKLLKPDNYIPVDEELKKILSKYNNNK
jgi:predicted HAD superfamily Cof-like phosphohydrolase